MKKKRKIPLRMCVACREMQDKRSLVRIVKAPEGDIRVDTTGKAKGRGAYLCRSLECIEQAEKRKALNRAFNVDIPDSIYEELRELAEKNNRK